MFARRYWPGRYFAPRYWPQSQGETPETASPPAIRFTPAARATFTPGARATFTARNA